MRRLIIPLIVAALLGLLSAGGCATSAHDSDMPWNTPQSWEGSISVPGLNRYD